MASRQWPGSGSHLDIRTKAAARIASRGGSPASDVMLTTPPLVILPLGCPTTISRRFISARVPISDPEPYVQQWSAGIQRQIGKNWMPKIDYVGSKSTHLDVIRNDNQRNISGGVSTGVVPFPNLGRSSGPPDRLRELQPTAGQFHAVQPSHRIGKNGI